MLDRITVISVMRAVLDDGGIPLEFPAFAIALRRVAELDRQFQRFCTPLSIRTHNRQVKRVARLRPYRARTSSIGLFDPMIIDRDDQVAAAAPSDPLFFNNGITIRFSGAISVLAVAPVSRPRSSSAPLQARDPAGLSWSTLTTSSPWTVRHGGSWVTMYCAASPR